MAGRGQRPAWRLGARPPPPAPLLGGSEVATPPPAPLLGGSEPAPRSPPRGVPSTQRLDLSRHLWNPPAHGPEEQLGRRAPWWLPPSDRHGGGRSRAAASSRRRGSPASRGRVGGAPAAGPGELSCPAPLPSAGRASPHCGRIWRSGPPRAWQSVSGPPRPPTAPPGPGESAGRRYRPGARVARRRAAAYRVRILQGSRARGPERPPPPRRPSGDSGPEARRPRARVTSGGPSRRRRRVSAAEWALPTSSRRRAAGCGCGKHREDFPEKDRTGTLSCS
ncbi:uncharacterized protein [Canis lupus baileyi]|uniref:uncharacterized protein n=1 Tax=Canis lupus baileyi TaxID=143281 RepID=UPI003B96A3E3